MGEVREEVGELMGVRREACPLTLACIASTTPHISDHAAWYCVHVCVCATCKRERVEMAIER